MAHTVAMLSFWRQAIFAILKNRKGPANQHERASQVRNTQNTLARSWGGEVQLIGPVTLSWTL